MKYLLMLGLLFTVTACDSVQKVEEKAVVEDVSVEAESQNGK